MVYRIGLKIVFLKSRDCWSGRRSRLTAFLSLSLIFLQRGDSRSGSRVGVRGFAHRSTIKIIRIQICEIGVGGFVILIWNEWIIRLDVSVNHNANSSQNRILDKKKFSLSVKRSSSCPVNLKHAANVKPGKV